MKRPEQLAVFAPVPLSTAELARRLVCSIAGEFEGFLGFNFFAHIEYRADDDIYVSVEDTPEFNDGEMLVRKIERDGNGMWAAFANFGFAMPEIYPAVFPAANNPGLSITAITIDSEVTRWVETEESTKAPFALALIRIAKLIESPWLFCGPNMYEWRSFDLSQPISHTDLCNPYVVAWKDTPEVGARLISDLKLSQDRICKSIHEYSFVSFIPDYS